jgi:hypothetical protein
MADRLVDDVDAPAGENPRGADEEGVPFALSLDHLIGAGEHGRRMSRRIKPHIGGVMPSRPTEMAAASSVPSSFLLAAEMKILAPGLSSLLSPGT